MLKRAFDILVSIAGLVVFSPLMLLIAIAIKLGSAGPVFYRATRVGRHGRLFKLYKFRTMVDGAAENGPKITAAGDSRVTAIGRILRRTKLDELPQLINVLRGEMSIVGPRPEDPRYVALYMPEQRAVLAVRPGITSQASVTFRNEESLLTGADWEKVYIERIMPAKLALDLEYMRRANLAQDVMIILRTLLALLR